MSAINAPSENRTDTWRWSESLLWIPGWSGVKGPAVKGYKTQLTFLQLQPPKIPVIIAILVYYWIIKSLLLDVIMTEMQKKSFALDSGPKRTKIVAPRKPVAQPVRANPPGMVIKSAGFLAFSGSPSQLIERMRGGINAHAVPAIADRLHISQDKLLEFLRLPKSTIKDRISKNKPLSSTEQDRIYRAEKAFMRAIAVFEEEESARNWMSRSIRSLGGETPLSLLDTEAGYELVMDTLSRIEFGVYA